VAAPEGNGQAKRLEADAALEKLPDMLELLNKGNFPLETGVKELLQISDTF
jgi:hypothetical protein